MRPDESERLAKILVGAFDRPQATADSYALAFADFDFAPMDAAIQKVILELDRLPSVKRVLGFYYGEREALRGSTVDGGYVACVPCDEFGGYRVVSGGTLHAPTAAKRPFIKDAKYVDDERKTHEVWPYESCCCHHGGDLLWSKMARQRGAAWTKANPAPATMEPRWLAAVMRDIALPELEGSTA